ncbi:hypothetical protein CROQUDRAFT_36725 [Cronartium quercuum f. sp. fusiforme G11]|uniref:Uncharacterized protein n=1 Tax=Cronartium quercuum f. sp. fusiforme G11 TaxID=708437 RepID=A0A9P6NW80_9BASI|nr:hypothetical protein CROQUDRAFT_36725 [Cronartium quercuum f. sp. fusiforme G11]
MSGCGFNKKYYNQLSVPYQINSCAGDSEEEDNDGVTYGNRPFDEEDMSNSINLMAPSEGSDSEVKVVDNLYFADGDFGDLYDESEDGDYTPDEEGESSASNEGTQFDIIGDWSMKD